jgi:hypothetical protein
MRRIPHQRGAPPNKGSHMFTSVRKQLKYVVSSFAAVVFATGD